MHSLRLEQRSLLNNLKVIALLLPFFLLSGCNGTTGSSNSEGSMQSSAPPTTSVPTAAAKNPPPAAGDAVRVARWSPFPNGPRMTARNGGTLAIVNNCLVITNQAGLPTLVIFPYDNGVWDDAMSNDNLFWEK
jgi:hypothetical protein